MVIGATLVRRTRHYVHVTCVLSTLLIGAAANAGSAEHMGETTGLERLVFRSSVYTDGPVTVTQGEYRAPAAPGSASEVIIRLTDKRVFGVLKGRPAGAVIVATETGGTGTFYELALLVKTAQGWTNKDTVLLGDRISVHSITIEKSTIVVAMTTHGPRDPMCCPTLEVQQHYAVRDGHLVALP